MEAKRSPQRRKYSDARKSDGTLGGLVCRFFVSLLVPSSSIRLSLYLSRKRFSVFSFPLSLVRTQAFNPFAHPSFLCPPFSLLLLIVSFARSFAFPLSSPPIHSLYPYHSLIHSLYLSLSLLLTHKKNRLNCTVSYEFASSSG